MLSAHEAAYLEQQRGFSDARVAADKHQRAFHKPSAEHPVKLGASRAVAYLVVAVHVADGAEFKLRRRSRVLPADDRRRLCFFDGVPASAGGASAVPL